MAQDVTVVMRLVTPDSFDAHELNETVKGLMGLLALRGVIVDDIASHRSNHKPTPEDKPRRGYFKP